MQRFAIGDFDSLQNRKSLEDLNIQILPERKMLRIRMLLSNMQFLKVVMKIELYGVTQRTFDHFFAVMCLFEKYQDVSIKVIDQQKLYSLLKPGNSSYI